ncbi:MAG: hypothetical protein KatS3mg008_0447 [Acidimicrobiales bacterium]|nr:MAG: hypothetical protein KatS3mg008_0447 [Acidimicrobiales bacterium]
MTVCQFANSRPGDRNHGDLEDACDLLVTPSSEIHLKSARTKRRMTVRLREALEDGIRLDGLEGRVTLAGGPGGRLRVGGPKGCLAIVAERFARTFGVQWVDEAVRIPWPSPHSLDDLVEACAAEARQLVAGRRFAVRVKRRGRHPWRAPDAERSIGAALLSYSAGVDLTSPEVTVRVLVLGEAAWLLRRRLPGPAGFPPGTQPRLLCLLSGGIDSAVAAWLMMRKGSRVDFVHFTLECAQSEHAMAVASELWHRWGAGSRPLFWQVDFRAVAGDLRTNVHSRDRQVTLKAAMLQAAWRVARAAGYPALVTGDSVGQVSSQTLANLAAVDSCHDALVLRPLAGLTKEEIVERARRIGTYELSTRAKEVCDLSDGPVETAADPVALARALEVLGGDLVEGCLAEGWRVTSLAHWAPGAPSPPVVSDVPPGRRVVRAEDLRAGAVGVEPLALVGEDAPHAASELAARGHDVLVVVGRDEKPQHAGGRSL